MLNNKSILITGGTGSFGVNFLRTITKKYKKIKRLVIFSRDEFKQFNLQQEFSKEEYPFLRYFLGDIRDKERIKTNAQSSRFILLCAASAIFLCTPYSASVRETTARWTKGTARQSRFIGLGTMTLW